MSRSGWTRMEYLSPVRNPAKAEADDDGSAAATWLQLHQLQSHPPWGGGKALLALEPRLSPGYFMIFQCPCQQAAEPSSQPAEEHTK